MRILAIDDDVKLLAEIKRILTLHGHTVDSINNADEAVALVKKNRYDFVLVDYRMPDHDGMWFLKHAALPAHTKALLVTSYVDRYVLRQMFDAGVSGYVMKPFDEEELLMHLKFYSDKRSAGQNGKRKEDAV
jgi:DNA-binding response OmpR family regulator